MKKYLKVASDCIKQNLELLKQLVIHNFGNVLELMMIIL